MLKNFPTKDYMKVALGVLAWPPSYFWSATPHEVRIAFDGWCEANGRQHQQGMDKKTLVKLMQAHPDI